MTSPLFSLFSWSKFQPGYSPSALVPISPPGFFQFTLYANLPLPTAYLVLHKLCNLYSIFMYRTNQHTENACQKIFFTCVILDSPFAIVIIISPCSVPSFTSLQIRCWFVYKWWCNYTVDLNDHFLCTLMGSAIFHLTHLIYISDSFSICILFSL
jgi:hypothetical protein